LTLKSILYSGLIFLLLSSVVSASSQYGSIDVYYNDKILPGEEVAKPILKIGEPFKVKVEMKLNQTSTLFIQVCSLGGNYFKVINGPSEFEKTKYLQSLDPGKYTFEWTIVPTDEWAGGTIPLNFWYQINLPEEDEPAVTGEFTVAYCTISNEYYEEKNPELKKQQVTEVETPAEIKSSSPSVSSPAFTLVGSIFTTALVFALSRKKL